MNKSRDEYSTLLIFFINEIKFFNIIEIKYIMSSSLFVRTK